MHKAETTQQQYEVKGKTLASWISHISNQFTSLHFMTFGIKFICYKILTSFKLPAIIIAIVILRRGLIY